MTDAQRDTGMGPETPATTTTRRTRRTRRLTMVGILALVLVAGATFSVVRGTVGNTAGTLTSGSTGAWVSPLAGKMPLVNNGGVLSLNYTRADGTGTTAQFKYPTAVVTVANTGVVYVADTGNNRVRKVVNPTPNANITTQSCWPNSAGLTQCDGGLNGQGVVTTLDIPFNAPKGLAVNSAGTILYVADTGNNRVQKIDLTVSPLTVSDVVTGLNGPTGLALNSAGTTLYIADTNNHSVKTVDLTTTPYTVTSLPTASEAERNTGAIITSTLYYPRSLSVDATGNVFVTDARDKWLGSQPERDPQKSIKKLTPGGTEWKIVVNVYNMNPQSLVVDSAGTLLYYTDESSSTVVRASVPTTTTPNKTGTTIAGLLITSDWKYSDRDGQGNVARFYSPTGIAMSADGTTLYVASNTSSRIVYIR